MIKLSNSGIQPNHLNRVLLWRVGAKADASDLPRTHLTPDLLILGNLSEGCCER